MELSHFIEDIDLFKDIGPPSSALGSVSQSYWHRENPVVHFVYSYRYWGISQPSDQLASPIMDDNLAPREKEQQSGNASREKKLYQKPAFRYERVFETQALSCGKVLSGINQCGLSIKTS
jgi:hypothetical protein